MKKLIALLFLASCTTIQATPSPDVTDVIILTGTLAPVFVTPLPTASEVSPQSTYTPRPTYTARPTASDYPTPSQEPSFTPTQPRPTRTPLPELFRMLQLPLPILNGSTSIIQVWCHFQYNYWVIRPYEMVFHRDDLDGTKETWCIQHNGRIQK